MKNFISVLFAFTLYFNIVSAAHASAAEKWEYEPVMKDMNIHVKGYKVDQYGNAVNDYEYNTKIDPKTQTNKTKMGTVGMGRLLKSSGWGLLGAAALEGLLEAVDWIIDPESQSIWRNKPRNGSTSPPNFGCTLTRTIGTDTYALKFTDQQGLEYNCAIDAAKAVIDKNVLDSNKWYKSGEFVRWHNTTLDPNQSEFRFYAKYNLTDGRVTGETWHVVVPKVGQKLTPEKEVMTPETLADYVNKTHPDYAKPELAEKLNPKHTPEIVQDLWKPSNQWEETNSPTVQEVQRKLDQAQPEPKTDPEIKPNPETGGSILPKFCDWAAPVCEFIKKDPDIEDPTLDIPEPELPQIDSEIKFSGSCPADKEIQVDFGLGVIKKPLSYEPICSVLSDAKPALILAGFVIAALIIGGVRTE